MKGSSGVQGKQVDIAPKVMLGIKVKVFLSVCVCLCVCKPLIMRTQLRIRKVNKVTSVQQKKSDIQ